MTRRQSPRLLPPRRILAVAAAMALSGTAGAMQAVPAPDASTPPGIPAATGATADTGETDTCPLGTFHCPPRPVSYLQCRPNAMLAFYEPGLPRVSDGRELADTDVRARHVDASDRSVYHLSGDVRLQRADQLLRADRLAYNGTTTDYDARGHVRYQDAGQLLAAERLTGNTAADRGTAEDVRYQLLQSHGNGSASQAELLDAMHSRYARVSYSTCDVGHHVWEVRARSLEIDKDTGVGTAHGATMRLADVPFLYLPYFTFPVDDRRKSGFLYPTFGNSNRSGLTLSMPYYLNLAPNYDATLTPRLFSERGTMLGAEGRYLLPGSRGTLNIEYLPSDRGQDSVASVPTRGTDRWLLKFADVTQLGGPWSFATSVNRVSDRSYLRDFGNDLYASAVSRLGSGASVRGAGDWWRASFGVSSYQNASPYLSDRIVPYKRWPGATFAMNVPLAPWLEFGADTEAVAFRRQEDVEGQRLDLYPYLGADFRGAAWFVRPKLAYRYTAYQLNGNYERYGYRGPLTGSQVTPFDDRTPSRSVPIASVDTALIFDRRTSLFGTSYTQTLEPRLYYLYVPYRDQSDLPVFDTRLMSFDYWQLFSPNRYSGADRQMNANDLTAAVTTRLLDEDGVERLSASLGQIRYFTPQRVQLPAGNTVEAAPTDWSGSDYVAQLGIQLNDSWRLNSAYQWSPNSRRTDLGTFEIQRRLGASGIVNFSYRYRRNRLEQYDASTIVPVSERWRLLGRWTYSVREQRTVEALAGVEYDSCCTAVRVVGRHYVLGRRLGTTVAETNNAIMLEVEFKGLGAFNGQTEEVLRRGILGYQ